MKSIPKSFAALSFLLIAFASIFSQTEPATARTKWQKYSVPDRDVSVLLPKLPVVFKWGGACNGEDRREYGAYSDGVVYVMAVVTKNERPSSCRQGQAFDETSFENRLTGLRNPPRDTVEETEVDIGGQKWKRLQNKKGIYLLYNDFANKRWFELWAFGADENKPEVKSFFESLKIEKKSGGIDIGNGADTVLGDETAEPPGEILKTDLDPGLSPPLKNPVSAPVIVLNPRPIYTEEARRHKVSGRIKLRVAFLSNGSTGAISVVGKELPDGLTEQAMTAARKTFFVPAKKESKLVSTEKILEYSFMIY